MTEAAVRHVGILQDTPGSSTGGGSSGIVTSDSDLSQTKGKSKNNPSKGKGKKTKKASPSTSEDPQMTDLSSAIVAALSSGPVLDSLAEAVMNKMPRGGSETHSNAVAGSVLGNSGETAGRGYVAVQLHTPHAIPVQQQSPQYEQSLGSGGHATPSCSVPAMDTRPTVLERQTVQPSRDDDGMLSDSSDDGDRDPFENIPSLARFLYCLVYGPRFQNQQMVSIHPQLHRNCGGR